MKFLVLGKGVPALIESWQDGASGQGAHTCVGARNSDDLLRLLRAESFDAVILDSGQPESDTLALVRRLALHAPEKPVCLLGEAGRKALAERLESTATLRCVPECDMQAWRETVAWIESHRAERDVIKVPKGRSTRPHDTVVFYASDMIARQSLEGVYSFVSPAAKEILGLEPEEVIGRSAYDFILPEDHHLVREIYEELRDSLSDRPRRMEYRLRRKTGGATWVETTARLVRSHNPGDPPEIVACSRDRTELKQNEELLRRRQEDILSLTNNIPDVIARFDRQFRHVYVNRRIEDYMGLPTEAFIGRTNRELNMSPALVELWESRIDEVFKTGRPVHFNFSFTSHARQEVHFDCLLVPEPGLTGSIDTVLGISRDVTDLYNVQADLEESRLIAESIVNTIRSPMLVLDPELTVRQANAAYYQQFMTDPEATDGQALYKLAGGQWDIPDLRRHLEGLIARAETVNHYELTHEFERLGKRTLLINARRMHLAGRDDQMILLVLDDITERKQLTTQLQMAQKMEAIGNLAGGIAHDFNNLMTVVTGYGALLLKKMAPDDAIRSKIESMVNAGQRASSLTQQLLAFSRRQIMVPRVLKLNTVIADLDKLLQRVISEDIVLSVQLADDLCCVRADPVQIEQVLMNLSVNARDAMPKGGHLDIRTLNAELDEAFVSQHPGSATGRYACLVVRDTGTGMDKSTMARIFEPYFTTKAEGRGTGLGLSTVYGIVKQSNGYIAVDSAPGLGTEFQIYFPIVDAPAETNDKPADGGAHGKGNETILVTEDETWVRELLQEVLTDNGYQVLTAANGDEALAIAQDKGRGIDMLLTDVVMPGMNGRDLAVRLRELRPSLRILFMTGYADNMLIRENILGAKFTYLEKPFTIDRVLKRVREILDAPVQG